MSEYAGGCACGAVRYVTNSEPLGSNHCHCLDCQKDSGTGHGSYVGFSLADVTITGETGTFDMIADSGNTKTRNFCPSCGVPVYLTFAGMPGFVAIRAPTLDDPSKFSPAFSTYAVRARAWDPIDPALPAFEKMPPMPA